MIRRTRMLVGSFMVASFICSQHNITASATDTDADDVTSRTRLRSTRDHNRRRLISKDENIVDVFATFGAARVGSLGFAIEAEDGDGADEADTSSSVADTTTHILHLDQMTSAVTSNTLLHFPERSLIDEKVDTSKITFLASPPSSRDLTVVSVNTNSREVNGLHQQGDSGMIRKISPKSNNNPTLQLKSTSLSSEARTFDCGVDHANELRRLTDTSLDTPQRSHHDDHGHHHHHNHDEGEHHHTPYLADTSNLRRLSTETAHKGLQIDLIVDIDRTLIKQNGGLERAIEYVNFIISTTNLILKKEFDLHLNVVQISETTLFNNLGDGTTRDALKLMRQTYHGTVGKYAGAHLRHALLGKELGGGIAFTDTVCDDSWGFGISSGLRGGINNLDMYDIFMFAHELGHNFGSGHPFDGEYSPPVDTCEQFSCPEGLPLKESSTLMSYCGHFCGGMSNTALTYGGIWDQISPREDVNSWLRNPALAESPISTDAQRISHNIWTKLAAKEECIGIRDPSSTVPLSTIFLVDKEEEGETTYDFLADMEEEETSEPTKSPSPSHSLSPSLPPSKSLSPTVTSAPSVTPTFTSKPSQPPSSFPSIAPTFTSKPSRPPSSSPSITPTSLPSFPPTAFPTNLPSSSPSKGIYSISPLKQCESRCKRTNGYMFNVKLEASASNDIEIQGINFRHKSPSVHRVIRVYTIKEGYKGMEESLESWTEIATGRAPRRNNFVSTVEVDPPLRIKAGETFGFYLQMEENIMIAGKFGKTETVDENAVKLQYGSAVVNGQFTENYSWSGSVVYQLIDN